MTIEAFESFAYGDSSENKDIIIWCPHDASSKDFFESYPVIFSILREQYGIDLLNKYLSIERDIGSLALAKRIGELVYQDCPQYAVLVVSSNLPRGIFDAARNENFYKRNIFTGQTIHKEFNSVYELYFHCLGFLNKIHALLKPHGIFIDLHSMAPCNPTSNPRTPTECLIESPQTLKKYVDVYCNSQYNGSKRAIDLITSINDILLADELILSSLNDCLSKAGLPYAHNLPFSTGEHLVASHIMRRCRGITIDIPKDMLSNESISKPKFDLANLTLDEDKIDYLARILAKAFLLAK